MAGKMYEGLFEGVEVRAIEMKLLEETYRQAVELAESNRWPQEEALLTVFAHGLAQLRADAAGTSEEDPDEDSLRRRLMRLEGMYSVMKFRTFTLTQENQRMRMALAAYQQEHGAMKRLVERLRAELEEAKRAWREEKPWTPEPIIAPPPLAAEHPDGILGRLRARLSRR